MKPSGSKLRFLVAAFRATRLRWRLRWFGVSGSRSTAIMARSPIDQSSLRNERMKRHIGV
jgi:hypothetical protein